MFTTNINKPGIPTRGAHEEIRTPDPRLKRALLYQLSYMRIFGALDLARTSDLTIINRVH